MNNSNVLNIRRESNATTKLLIKENSVMNNSIYYIAGLTHTPPLIEVQKDEETSKILSSEAELSEMNRDNDPINKNKKLLQLLKKQKSTSMTGMSFTSKSDDDLKKPKVFIDDYKNSDMEVVFQAQIVKDSASDNRTPSFKDPLETENSRERDGISSIGDCLGDYLEENRISLPKNTPGEKFVFSPFNRRIQTNPVNSGMDNINKLK